VQCGHQLLGVGGNTRYRVEQAVCLAAPPCCTLRKEGFGLLPRACRAGPQRGLLLRCGVLWCRTAGV
jgi:hypothetical protein